MCHTYFRFSLPFFGHTFKQSLCTVVTKYLSSRRDVIYVWPLNTLCFKQMFFKLIECDLISISIKIVSK